MRTQLQPAPHAQPLLFTLCVTHHYFLKGIALFRLHIPILLLLTRLVAAALQPHKACELTAFCVVIYVCIRAHVAQASRACGSAAAWQARVNYQLTGLWSL